MKRQALLFLGLLCAALPASAIYHPVFDYPSMTVKVGETRYVGVRAMWTGFTPSPWRNWTFQSTVPDVAEVSGLMESSQPYQVPVTGIRPGEAAILVRPYSWNEYVRIFVICGEEDPIQPAQAEIDTILGRTVTLEAVTPIAHRTTFTWYRGRLGDTTQPLAISGPEATLAAEKIGTQYAWVLATTPCSSSTAEFRIDARTSKQRSVRR